MSGYIDRNCKEVVFFMSKKIFFCAAALCAALLAGCGDSREENSTVKQQNNMLYEDAQGSWQEEFDASLEDGGKVKVSIDAEITKPSSNSVFVTEVAEFGFSQDYKETVLKQIFGEAELYMYDMKSIPQKQLTCYISELSYEADMLEEEIEQASDDEQRARKQFRLDSVKDELEQYRDCIDSAPLDFVSAKDMSGDAFAGYKDGIMFAVYFQNYLNENPKGHYSGIFNSVKPDEVSYPVRNQSIIIEPVDMREAAPKEMKNALIVKPDDMFDFQQSGSIGTEQAIADRFIQNLGLNGARFDYITDGSTGKQTGGCGNIVWTSAGVSSVTEGYYFNYGIALDTENNIKAYEFDAVYNKWGKYADSSNPQYSRRSCMTVYVKDQKVIYAEINNPLEVVSVNQGVEVLSFDIIKDIVRSELADSIQDYTANGIQDGMSVSFQTMCFDYVRVRDGKRGDLYSYVPAWKLFGRNSSSLDWGAENMIIINAIDGTPIYVRDLI